MKRTVYKTIDLCAGIGGIRRGFELTRRFKNVAACEIDKRACQTYRHLFKNDEYEINNDITSESFKQQLERTEYDVLLAGFPCQAFSSAGLQQGFADKTKGTIFFDIANIIKRTAPKAIFLENVQNLFSHDKGRTIEIIIKTLEEDLDYKIIGVDKKDGHLCYNIKSFLRNSKNFGVPQNRPRVYIIGFNRRYFGDAIAKIDGLYMPERRIGNPIFEDVDAIIEHDVDMHYYMSVNYWNTLLRHKINQRAKGNGFGYCVVNDESRESKIANTILATGGSGKERNLVRQYKDGVAGTKLEAKSSVLNGEGIRVMTPLEWARLQGFAGYAFMSRGKDKFSFPDDLPEGYRYKQLGNAVTIPVVNTLAKFMLQCINIMEKTDM